MSDKQNHYWRFNQWIRSHCTVRFEGKSTPSRRFVLSTLASYANDAGQVTKASSELLVRVTGFSHSTVERAISDLVREGLIEITRRGAYGCGPNHYQLRTPGWTWNRADRKWSHEDQSPIMARVDADRVTSQHDRVNPHHDRVNPHHEGHTSLDGILLPPTEDEEKIHPPPGALLDRGDVDSAWAFAVYVQQHLNTPLPDEKDLARLNELGQERFREYPHINGDWSVFCGTVTWYKATKPTVLVTKCWYLLDKLFPSAATAGNKAYMPELDPYRAHEERLAARVHAALDVEPDREWRGRLVRSEGAGRAELLDRWEAQRRPELEGPRPQQGGPGAANAIGDDEPLVVESRPLVQRNALEDDELHERTDAAQAPPLS